jgi:hypothetical protein
MLLMTKSHHQFDDENAALGFPQGKLKEFSEVRQLQQTNQ